VTGLGIGAHAPDFALRDQHGQRFALSDCRRKADVLLVFFPWAFSSVCSAELATLRDKRAELPSSLQVLGVSCDPMYSLRAASDAERLDFPLLSDFWPHGAVASAYGVFDHDLGVARRSSFLLDREGLVRWQVHSAMPDARPLDDYLSALAGLSTGEADD
jgi:mycoredoxin-dependent peroxiredoxin